MPNSIKNSSIIVIAILVVVAAGFLAYVQFTEEPTKEPTQVAEQPVDPETQVDKQVQQAGRNYIDSEIVDNRFTRSIYMGNVTYLTEDDTYQSIDTTIVESDSDYNYENTTNVFKSYFKADATADDLIKFQIGDRAVSFSFVDANESSPTSKDNTITYPDVYDGLDAKYTITGNEFIEELIADEKISIEKISQEIKLDGVYYKEQSDGSITFHSTETKNIVFTIPKPVMYEKDNPEQNNFGLHFEISSSKGGYIISKIIDQAGQDWLAQANYPVVIDYTLTIYNPNTLWDLEGYIRRQGYPPVSDSYTAFPSEDVGPTGGFSDATYSYFYRTFFNFDLATLGSATVESAYFEHYSRKTSSVNVDINVYAGADAWSALSPNRTVFESDLVMGDGDPGTDDYMDTFSNSVLPLSCSVPADCRHQITIPPAWFPTIFTGSNAQFLFVCDSICEGGLGFTNFRGTRSYMSSYEQSREPRLVLELTVAPPGLAMDPVVAPGTLEPRLSDYSDNETSWVMQRSLNGVSFVTICDNMVSGSSSTCSPVATASYDCSGTSSTGYFSGGTCSGAATCICTFADTNLNPNDQYYYRAYAERDSPYAQSSYSNIVSAYTLAAPITGAPTVESNTWQSFELTAFPSGIPASTSYCVGAYFQDWPTIPSPATRYAVNISPPDYYLTETLPLSDCHTQSDWALLGIPTTPMPIIGSWPEGRVMYPNRLFEFGLYAINSDGLPTEPAVKKSVYTRARNPAGLIATELAAPPGETEIELTLTPGSNNPSFTEYSIQSDSSSYVNEDSGNYTLGGAEEWLDISGWGGGSAITVGGLSPATCYNFRSHVRNGDVVIGENENDPNGWVNSTPYPACTLAAQPTITSVVCNYEEPEWKDPPGVFQDRKEYYCTINVNVGGNAGASTRYEIRYSTNGGVSWNNVNNNILKTNNFSYNDDRLTCDSSHTNYIYQVRAHDPQGGGTTDWDPELPTTIGDILPPCPLDADNRRLDHFDNPICTQGSFQDDPMEPSCGSGYSEKFSEFPVFWYWDKAISEQPLEYYQVLYVPETFEGKFYCMAGVYREPSGSQLNQCDPGREEVLLTASVPPVGYNQTWYKPFGLTNLIPGYGISGDTVIFKQYFRTGTKFKYQPEVTLPNNKYQIAVRGIDDRGRFGKLTYAPSAHSSIEHVDSLNLSGVTTNRITVTAENRFWHCPFGSPAEPFCNLADINFPNTGLWFDETTGRPGGGNLLGNDGFDASQVDLTLSDRRLDPNRKYCYRARSLNEDYQLGGPGDITNYTSTECKYTLSVTPSAPRLTRFDGTNDVNVEIIPEIPQNPWGDSWENNTRYALCITKYDDDIQVESYKYVDPLTGIYVNDASAPDCDPDNPNDSPPAGYWAPQESGAVTDWGGVGGTLITGLTSSKYDFMFKAKNGNGVVTGFGSAATLFLVKNNIVGWAWSSNIGWISMNCLNMWSNPSLYGYSCNSAGDWGLNTYFEETREINPIEGYAWVGSGQTLPDVGWSEVQKMSYDSYTLNHHRTSTDENVAIDSFGQPHIVWADLDSGSEVLFYAKWDGRDWVGLDSTDGHPEYDIISGSGDGGSGSITIDSNDNPHVAWNDHRNDIYYTRWNPVASQWVDVSDVAGWTNVSFDIDIDNPTVKMEYYPSLKIDEDGHPHIALMSSPDDSNYKTYYTEWDGSNWIGLSGGAYEQISSDNVTAWSLPSLALERVTGYPHVVMRDGTKFCSGGASQGINCTSDSGLCTDGLGCFEAIYYTRWDGASWTALDRPVVDLYDPKNTSLALDKKNNAQITVGGVNGTYFVKWDDTVGNWRTIDGQVLSMPGGGDEVNSYRLMYSDSRFSVDVDLDRSSNPHITAQIGQNLQYMYWDPIAIDAGTGAWVTASGEYSSDGSDPTDLPNAVVATEDGLSNSSISLDNQDNAHIVWQDESTGVDDRQVYYRFWDTGIGQAGLGWISMFRGICANDHQKACADVVDCNGAACVESAGLPAEGGYGYCYNVTPERYGVCSNDQVTICTAETCGVGNRCIYNTCHEDTDCLDSTNGPDTCKVITTANFDGVTREIKGFGRIMSLKDEGESQGDDNVGWLKLQGTYNDEGETGPYATTGIEIDSQSFLGDPDVNPNDVKLYSMLGWGWNSEVSDFMSSSSWLPPTNVSQTGVLPKRQKSQNYSRSTVVLDSVGDPHITWSNLEEDSTYNVYYLKLKAGKWVTVTGEDYQPGVSDSSVNVTSPSGSTSHSPILTLDSNDNPHISWVEDGEGIYYLKWSPINNRWESVIDTDRGEAFLDDSISKLRVDAGSQLSMVLDRNDRPHLAYRYTDNDIYYCYWDGSAWAARSNVSTGDGNMPRLVLNNDAIQKPNIVWVSGGGSGAINFRRWDGSDWVTASDNTDATDLQINWDVTDDAKFQDPDINDVNHGEDPDIALYSDNRPGIVWRDPAYVLYREWNGSNWVSVSNQLDDTDVWLNREGNADSGKQVSVIIRNDRPNIAWSDGDVHLRHWSGSNWVSADGIEQISHNDVPYNVTGRSPGLSQNPSMAMDDQGGIHLVWNEAKTGDQCDFGAGAGADDICFNNDPNFPQCIDWYPNDYCATSDINYTKWFPGVVQSGLGWVEFMPAGALLGIPWVQTMFSDIYASESVVLSPPPRGIDAYTSTFLILAGEEGDTIRGIPGYYSGAQTGAPTTSYYEPGFDPLITGAGNPLGEDVLDRLNLDQLVAETSPGSGVNKYGNPVKIDVSAGTVDISMSAELGGTPSDITLDGTVYHFTGATRYTIDNEMMFSIGDIATDIAGNGLIVIDGDLEINKNILYQDLSLADISEMPSVAIVVRGDVYISPFVSEISGVFVAVDDPSTPDVTEGTIHTSRKAPARAVVANSVDDTYVSFDGASSFTNNTGLDDIQFGNAAGEDHRAFLRWSFGNPLSSADFNIPPGSEIRDSYLNVYGTAGNEIFDGKIYLINTNDVPAFDTYVSQEQIDDLFNIATSNSISYPLNDDTWTNDQTNGSPNIKSLIQRYINSDEYANTYYGGTASHLGLTLREGNAEIDEYRTFSSADQASNPEPELVIEYTPRRTKYSIGADVSEAVAWDDTNPAACDGTQCTYVVDCMNFGWYDSNPNRVFLRFTPPLITDPDYTQVPVGAEIIDAQLKVTARHDEVLPSCFDATNTGIEAFQGRIGLLAGVDIAAFDCNPNVSSCTSMSQSVSEVAWDIESEAWVDADEYYLPADIAEHVEAWVDEVGHDGSSHVGFRLRRGTNEFDASDGASRSIYQQIDLPGPPGASELIVDYKLPLLVNGLFVAEGFNFDRKYTKNLAASERILYDGRVVANTPPGLSDFTEALPLYDRVP